MPWVHTPILANKIADMLITDPGAAYLDGTLGLGGHTKVFLGRLGAMGRVIGLDKDSKAIAMAAHSAGDARLLTFNLSYLQARAALDKAGVKFVQGALFDLGLSSYQLDDATRGFSFLRDGPLDMRFDTNQPLSAQDIVNNYSFEKLEDILKNYGGQGAAHKITAAIINARSQGQITTTKQLAAIIEGALPRAGKIHPATKTFQALRIAVNDELASVSALPKVLPQILAIGGRAAVLTFHSDEDRIIKHAFKQMAQDGHWQLVNKKVLEPHYEEIKQNPRARSAKLRVIERVK